MNHDTFYRLYGIGGGDLAFRYAEISFESRERRYRIESLRLFESGGDLPERDDRVFADRFPRSTTRYIYFQLDIRNPWEHIENDCKVVARYYRADGSLMDTLEQTSIVQP